MIIHNGCNLASFDQPLVHNNGNVDLGIYNGVIVYDKNCVWACNWKGAYQYWGPYFEYSGGGRYSPDCVRARYCVCIRHCICGCYKCHNYPWETCIWVPGANWCVYPYFQFKDASDSDCPTITFNTYATQINTAGSGRWLCLSSGGYGAWCYWYDCWNVYTNWNCCWWDVVEPIYRNRYTTIAQGVNFNYGTACCAPSNVKVIHTGSLNCCSAWRSTVSSYKTNTYSCLTALVQV